MQVKLQCFLLFALFASVNADSIKITLQRKHDKSFNSSELKLSNEEVQLTASSQSHKHGLYNSNYLSSYYGTINVAGQELSVLFSTSAETNFFVGSLCQGCTDTEQKFECYQQKGCEMTDTALSTSDHKVRGRLAHTELKLGTATPAYLNSLIAENMEYSLPQSGIISLSRKKDNLIDSLYDQHLIEQKMFTLRYSEENAELVIDEPANLEDYTFFDLSSAEEWTLPLENMQIEGTVLNKAPLKVAIDSSITSTLMPESLVNALRYNLRHSGWECDFQPEEGFNQLACFKEGSSEPLVAPLSLRFGDKDYTLPPQSWLLSCVSKKGGQHCVTNIALNSYSDDIRMGDQLLQFFAVAFDAGAGRIGLAETIRENYSENPDNEKTITDVIAVFAAAVLCVVLLFGVVWLLKRYCLSKKRSYMPFTDQEMISKKSVGSTGGDEWSDEQLLGQRVFKPQKITIRHGGMIDSMQVTYTNAQNQVVVAPDHGGQGGKEEVIQFETDEFINEVFGHHGKAINQIGFGTNKGKRYGPYGGKGGMQFGFYFGEEEFLSSFSGRSHMLVSNLVFHGAQREAYNLLK